MPRPDELSLFVKHFEIVGAPYMMIGATAAIFYGQSRATYDLDVCCPESRRLNTEGPAARLDLATTVASALECLFGDCRGFTGTRGDPQARVLSRGPFGETPRHYPGDSQRHRRGRARHGALVGAHGTRRALTENQVLSLNGNARA